MNHYDVAIIGGGAAGLSAALTLARARRQGIVLDAGTPRNASSPGVQGFLSRDGIEPGELRQIARAEIEGYGGIEFINLAATRIVPRENEDGYRIETAPNYSVTANFVVLATGMIDRFPDIDGLSRHWGKDFIHCEFCHGWENAGGRWATIVNHPEALSSAERLLNWTQDITAIVPVACEIKPATAKNLAHRGVVIEPGTVVRLVPGVDGKLTAVELADGRKVACETLIFQPDQAQSPIVLESELELNSDGRVIVDENYETSMSGIYAGGDIVPGPQSVLNAAATGAAIGRRLAFLLAMNPVSRPTQKHSRAAA